MAFLIFQKYRQWNFKYVEGKLKGKLKIAVGFEQTKTTKVQELRKLLFISKCIEKVGLRSICLDGHITDNQNKCSKK